MAYIPSANPDGLKNNVLPTRTPNYSHGLDKKKTYIPMCFQVTSPFDRRAALLPTALVMHVNPATFSEDFSKKIERIQTRGGFVEQHWPDALSGISGSGSTGAFMNIKTGLTAISRKATIAWSRYRDLLDLFHHNGSVFDPAGNIVLQGNIMLMYDRGIYIGFFKTFEPEETEESPFAFQISWSFQVQETVLQLPMSTISRKIPPFQLQNTVTGNTLGVISSG